MNLLDFTKTVKYLTKSDSIHSKCPINALTAIFQIYVPHYHHHHQYLKKNRSIHTVIELLPGIVTHI